MFNVVTGFGPTAGRPLVRHPGVDKVAFTGSTDVGIAVMKDAADHLARVSLELGGKSPNIVFDDADQDAAVNGVIAGIFAATGQTCIAGSRLFVHERVHDELVSRVAERARTIKLGNPLDMASEMGPVAFKEQLEKIERMIEMGVDDIPDAELPGTLANLGGHDLPELLRAFSAAEAVNDRPTVLFAYTIKGWGLPIAGDQLNHAALLTPAQIATLAPALGADLDDPWAAFDPGTPAERLCADVAARLREPHRRLGRRRPGHARPTVPPPGEPGRMPGDIGPVPPGPREPLPRRARGLLRGGQVGGRQRGGDQWRSVAHRRRRR